MKKNSSLLTVIIGAILILLSPSYTTENKLGKPIIEPNSQ